MTKFIAFNDYDPAKDRGGYGDGSGSGYGSGDG